MQTYASLTTALTSVMDIHNAAAPVASASTIGKDGILVVDAKRYDVAEFQAQLSTIATALTGVCTKDPTFCECPVATTGSPDTNGGPDTCTPCAVDTYKGTTGSAPCTRCEEGYTSEAGSSKCEMKFQVIGEIELVGILRRLNTARPLLWFPFPLQMEFPGGVPPPRTSGPPLPSLPAGSPPGHRGSPPPH